MILKLIFNILKKIKKFLIYSQVLIVLCEKVIETITVHENECNNLLFWCIETNVWIHFRKKFFLFECFGC